MRFLNLVLFVAIVCSTPAGAIFLVIPEDVATGFAAIYGFSPRLFFGGDHRLGFGFRFGNHADLQVLYELGPQLTTKNFQQPRVRSAAYRQRTVRRRPLKELLLRAGLVKEAEYRINYDTECDEPR